jgi:Na+/glutamate symporter
VLVFLISQFCEKKFRNFSKFDCPEELITGAMILTIWIFIIFSDHDLVA